MFAMSQYFFENMLVNDDILIFQEVLIDELFDYFDEELVTKSIGVEDIIKFKTKLNQELNVKIILRKTSDIELSAKFIRPDIIELFFPDREKYRQNITNKDIIRVFLHELAHMLIDKKIPDEFTPKRGNNQDPISLRLKNPPSKNINLVKPDENTTRQFLDYVYQPREIANFALSIALCLCDHYRNISTKSIFNENDKIIKQNNLELIKTHFDQILGIENRLFFEIHYFSKYLKSSTYFKSLIRLRNLIEKYRRRILLYY